MRLPSFASRLAGGMLLAASMFGAATAQTAPAATEPGSGFSNKLLLTGGVTNIEGAAGGGLTPWAVIGGYGTRDEVGGGAFVTGIRFTDYTFTSAGASIGLFNRVELSVARQTFDTRRVGQALGLGSGFKFHQTVLGAKVRLFGDAVLDQDSWLPQVAIGAFYKNNDRDQLVRAIGAKRDSDMEYYVSATKLFLSESLLINATLRLTRANQFGILGFGGGKNDDYQLMPEASLAYLLRKDLAIGAEYRRRPNNLGIAKEEDAYDLFLAYQPWKHTSITLAYVDLGNVVIKDNQRGVYLSVQVGF
ncbi:MAG: DUF3034 family protein [Alphaproteobacteria bacterium]|nr:DUF3034 family protein [Alphaproteobacteria bacterium]